MNALCRRLVARCDRILDQGLEVMKTPYVSCSWGKDSTTLLWLVRRHRPRIPVVWFASAYALPDIYRLRDRLVAEWDLDYREVMPFSPEAYLEGLLAVGLADIHRDAHRAGPRIRRVKTQPALAYAAEQGFDGLLWGLRADESATRRLGLSRWGPVHRPADGLWRCAPLAWVTGPELWYLIDTLEIPYARLYDHTLFEPRERIRNSGWLSTGGARDRGRLQWLRHYYPEQWRQLCELFPEVKRYS